MKAIIVAICATIAFSLGFAPSAQATIGYEADVVVSLQMSESEAILTKTVSCSYYVWTYKANKNICRKIFSWITNDSYFLRS